MIVQKALEHCGHRSVAKYFHTLINSNNHMYFNNNGCCYNNSIWKLSSDEIYVNFDNIIIYFEIYNYLIENINKHIDTLNNKPFLNCTDNYIKK